MSNLIAQTVLGAVVLAGAATDWRKRKIPNWLTLPAMGVGLAINSVSGIGLLKAVEGMLAALAVYFLFFAIGFRGAGDGKLMGAVGAFVGWPEIATVMVLVALAAGAAALLLAWRCGAVTQVIGGALALARDMVCLRWGAVKQQSNFRSAGALTMPHGPVIAAGTLAFLFFAPR